MTQPDTNMDAYRIPAVDPRSCEACTAAGYPEFCEEGHTESVVRLAVKIAESLRNEEHPLMEQASWYVNDARAVADDVAEGDGWVVSHDPGCLGEYFTVNDVEFWLDMNAEGLTEPVLAVEHRAELAEEEQS